MLAIIIIIIIVINITIISIVIINHDLRNISCQSQKFEIFVEGPFFRALATFLEQKMLSLSLFKIGSTLEIVSAVPSHGYQPIVESIKVAVICVIILIRIIMIFLIMIIVFNK